MNLQKRNEEMRAFFALRIDGYDAVHEEFLPTKNVLTEAMPQDAHRILDIGAGTGLELFALFARFPHAEVTAVDICTEMLSRLAERPFAARVKCVCGDFFTTDLGTGYDAVISTSALHHFAPKDKLLLYRRILDALHPGGVFLNSDYIALSSQEEADRFAAYRDNDGSIPHIDTPLTPEHEHRLLIAAGFSNVTAEPTPRRNYLLFHAIKP